ncbi:MAG: Ger(x)C family spore germination C-terminal domain-containing protein [Eubacteriales bacterium]|nr:Ger(x)C family spore germination C-terminal domain-containing protein [Eubacteriales bacterium]
MKKMICILMCIALLLLSGCGGIYDNCRDVEQLLVAETLGLDYIPGGVRVSCASSMGSREPVQLSGVGTTIEAALENIRNRRREQSLFVRHTEHIIVGEEAARRGMEDILEYICRSPDMRIDTPLYILRGNDASALISGAGDISRIMDGISDYPDGALRSTASDILGDTLHRSGALVGTLELSRSSGGSDEITALPAGSAVIRDDRLCAFLDAGETLGAAFLANRVNGGTLTVSDSRTGTVSLSVTDGGCDIYPILSEAGELTGISVSARLSAAVSEIDGGVAAGSAVYMRRLTDLTEELLSEKINSVLRLAASLGTDFLGLGERMGREEEFVRLLPALEMQVTVSAALSHTNDMRDSV